MDWTIQDFAHANHSPLAVVNGQSGTAPLEVETEAGRTLTFDAAGTSDPDGQAITYRWFVYSEAGLTGTHGADVAISGEDRPVAKLEVKSPCRTPWLPGLAPCQGPGVAHIILAVTDTGSPPLTSYRRVVVKVDSRPQSRHGAPAQKFICACRTRERALSTAELR